MTDRLSYILKQALRNHLGIWFSDSELDRLVQYLSSQGIKIGETSE